VNRPSAQGVLRSVAAAACAAGVAGGTYVLVAPESTGAQAAGTAAGAAPTVPGLPPGATRCPQVYQGIPPLTASAIGTPFTSCGFAEEVRRAYGAPSGDPRRVVQAASTVTRKSYEMYCIPTDGFITCSGGGDAVVYLFGDR